MGRPRPTRLLDGGQGQPLPHAREATARAARAARAAVVTGGSARKPSGADALSLPPRWHRDEARLRAFLAAVPPGRPQAVEFRDATWYADEVLSALDEARVGLCLHDMPGSAAGRGRSGRWSTSASTARAGVCRQLLLPAPRGVGDPSRPLVRRGPAVPCLLQQRRGRQRRPGRGAAAHARGARSRPVTPTGPSRRGGDHDHLPPMPWPFTCPPPCLRRSR